MSKYETTYKDLAAELDEIVARLQDQQIGVDEALSAYERGMEIIQQLQAQLDAAQVKVQKMQSTWRDAA